VESLYQDMAAGKQFGKLVVQIKKESASKL
jgi:hypothetical protein